MKKKILLAIILVVLLLGFGAAYAYFGTDIFKTDKQIFLSYIFKENTNNILSKYIGKQQNTPYTNNGNITVDVSGVNDESIDVLNNLKIALNGKTNKNQKQVEQDITLDFGQGFNVPIHFRTSNNTYGIQSDLLNSKYIAIRNENLKQLAEKFNLDTESIPDKLEISGEQFTEEDLKTLKTTYSKILIDNLEDELFSKEKVEKQTIVKLKMSEKKFVDILSKILETASNDEILLKLYTSEQKETLQKQIEELKSELSEIELEETNTLEISLYIESRKVNKCELKFIEDSKTIAEIILSETATESEIAYNIIAKIESDEEQIKTDSTITYRNLDKLDDVKEIFDINLEINTSKDDMDLDPEDVVNTNIKMNINFENTKSFNENLQIEELNADNAIVLNDATDEELQNLVLGIYKQLGLI